MHDYMIEILEKKKDEIKKLKTAVEKNPSSDLAKVMRGELNMSSSKSLKRALQEPGISVIAEIKRKSPSKGDLAEIKNPVELAKQYLAGGAAALSILTDSFAFNGSINDLIAVSDTVKNTSTPILRKDFILDEIQIAESILLGANAVLLIVSALKETTKRLLRYCRRLGIDALVEVHDPAELDDALSIGAEIIGVNNRNLNTFEVDTDNATELKKHIPDHIISVAESGIHSTALARHYADIGYNAILVGEALVKSGDPKKLIRRIKQTP